MIGTAPFRPTQDNRAGAPAPRSRTAAGAGRRPAAGPRRISTAAMSMPCPATSTQFARRGEQAQHDEHRDLAHPGQAIEEQEGAALEDHAAVADDDAGQVDRQETAAAEPSPPPEGEEAAGAGEHRIEAGGLEVDAVDERDREPPDAEAHQRADAHLRDEQPREDPARTSMRPSEHLDAGRWSGRWPSGRSSRSRSPAWRRAARAGAAPASAAPRRRLRRPSTPTMLPSSMPSSSDTPSTARPPAPVTMSGHEDADRGQQQRRLPRGRSDAVRVCRPPSNRIAPSASVPIGMGRHEVVELDAARARPRRPACPTARNRTRTGEADARRRTCSTRCR